MDLSPNAAAENDHADLMDALSRMEGRLTVVTDLAERTFFSTDIAGAGVTAAAVVKVCDVETLSQVVRACTERDYGVIPRGGGFSYTGGYTPGQARTVIIDLRPMDAILEINTQDMYVVVEGRVHLGASL